MTTTQTQNKPRIRGARVIKWEERQGCSRALLRGHVDFVVVECCGAIIPVSAEEGISRCYSCNTDYWLARKAAEKFLYQQPAEPKQKEAEKKESPSLVGSYRG